MQPLSRSTAALRYTSCEHRTHRMFCNLSEAALADFDAIGVQTLLAKGAILFREHDPGDGVLVICNGQVKLSCTSRCGQKAFVDLHEQKLNS
jgi:CRP/FNR family transcriptional regulator, cyclic AMP receptor protein